MPRHVQYRERLFTSLFFLSAGCCLLAVKARAQERATASAPVHSLAATSEAQTHYLQPDHLIIPLSQACLFLGSGPSRGKEGDVKSATAKAVSEAAGSPIIDLTAQHPELKASASWAGEGKGAGAMKSFHYGVAVTSESGKSGYSARFYRHRPAAASGGKADDRQIVFSDFLRLESGEESRTLCYDIERLKSEPSCPEGGVRVALKEKVIDSLADGDRQRERSSILLVCDLLSEKSDHLALSAPVQP